MKKTLLAAALLAGFAGVAQAQSSVTLYGIVDVGIGGTNKHDQDSSYGMVSGVQSGSRWGLRGTEDLGNGLRANFQLESGFDVGRGTQLQGSRLFGRAAWGGLSGAWGETRFGRQVTASSDTMAFIDPFGTGFQQAAIGSSMNGVSTNRADNTVSYITPDVAGFRGMVGYSFNYDGGVATSDNSNRLVSVGLKYANGPFAVGAAYERAYIGDTTAWNTAMGGKDPYNYTVGGTWDFNVVKAYAAWSQMKHGYTNPGNGDVVGQLPSSGTLRYFPDGKVNAYMVGLSVPVGQAAVFGSWQRNEPKSGYLADNGFDSKQNVYSIGATYDLSKRTNLYAFFSYADKAWYDSDFDSKAYAVGIRHRF
ncbi:porin [Verticiella sediminum]|uniref:Porin n=1 Tax=Verticiella sediminum TaxID=1247510 RepID=A0A556AFB5_9BURK|nr:porin [Verticiella sediminum]TSH91584.1 porin [Verticiella sediminum]